jgi:hypothetical protein
MIYWGETDTTGRTNVAQLDGGGVRTIDPSAEANSFAFGRDRIYWVARGTDIKSAPRGDDVGSPLLGNERATALVLAGDRLYWTTKSGLIRSSDLTGQDVRTLADKQNNPVSIAADGDALYWVNQGGDSGTGEVVRMPR